MVNTRTRKYFCFIVLLSTTFSPSVLAQTASDFSGDWALKLGNRTFIVVTLTAGAGGRFSGSLVCPQHFWTGGVNFSEITGPAVHYPIVDSSVKENCLYFTTQKPTDANDKDDFRLCVASKDRGTLKIDLPGFEDWPVTKEKGPLVVATDWDSSRIYLLDDSDVSSPEMKKVFDEDQRVRQPGAGNTDWAAVEKTDAARRETTRQLLADGKLHTGQDFERASFVFQHGDSPDDYLLAHTLAMVAVARGQSRGIWIAAATLDRYLNSIHEPQIYGTQFYTPSDKPATQEPYHRGLISDALRRQLGVPSQAAQEEQRKQYEKEKSHR